MSYPKIDVRAVASAAGVDFDAVAAAVRALYAEVDARNADNTRGLELPCHRGCDACCKESVFLTPLEFLVAWDWAQEHLDEAARSRAIEAGLALYAQHEDLIVGLSDPARQHEHDALARQLRFVCPLLGEGGTCQVYPVRELLARLFGCSFNDDLGVYGCHLVGAHLAGKTVKLLPVRPTAARLAELPLTGKRQVYPYYFHLFYGR